MIPGRVLEEIEGRLDIVSVVGGYLTLKKSGRNFKGLCPFHPEKTPSFMVYPQKQFFICYGCGAGGDLITFVMKHEHLEFPEAVKLLAQKAGVEVPRIAGAPEDKASKALYEAHELAQRFYHDLLTKEAEGEQAREYLKKRGVPVSVWDTFGLGYAPHPWNRFLEYAKEQGMSPEGLERCGLVVAKEARNGWYDRFRDRVMFPIWDTRGRVVAFGGRVLEEAEAPKYLNSPETELYVKGRLLYGWHLASSHIRERDFCIVVEGYMDVITPHQHGIRNLVASMGTSLTPEQVKLIKRLTRHVVIVYDGDYAGEMASLRGLDLFLEAEMRVKVAALPAGFDPDSLIRKQGLERFVQAIQGSMDLFDYKLSLLKRTYDLKELEGRIRICEEILPTIKRVTNAVERGEYIKRLAQALEITEDLLWAELQRVKLDASWKPQGLGLPRPSSPATAEDFLAGLLLEDPRQILKLAGRLEPQDLASPEVRQLVQWLITHMEQQVLPEDHKAFIHRLPRGDGNWENRLAKWLALADTMEEKESALEELLDKIEADRRKASLTDLRALIRQAEEQGDEAKTAALIFEYNRLVKGVAG